MFSRAKIILFLLITFTNQKIICFFPGYMFVSIIHTKQARNSLKSLKPINASAAFFPAVLLTHALTEVMLRKDQRDDEATYRIL